jgi:hypothetical protein
MANTLQYYWRRVPTPKIIYLAVVEVNARLAHFIFSQSDALSQLNFRQLLVKELMDFSFVVNAGM